MHLLKSHCLAWDCSIDQFFATSVWENLSGNYFLNISYIDISHALEQIPFIYVIFQFLNGILMGIDAQIMSWDPVYVTIYNFWDTSK